MATIVQGKKKYIPALGYDQLTGYYDLIVRLTMPEKEFRKRLIDAVAPHSGETILEFGAGTGQNLIALQQRNNQIRLTGVDIDPKVNAIAARKIAKHGFRLQLDLYDGATFPYADHSFDKVFSSLVFHQLDSETKHACLQEIYRVLKPGGRLVIGDWGRPASIWMRCAFYLVQLVDGFKTTHDNVKGRMPAFISRAGFKDVCESDFINTGIGTFCYYLATK
ncbi:class I SAM-dependent methyltransferase [Chitinophaga solisilvae]|uniref:class I SAM-dependent methyltransferase n=1 Tax=Chitinophaga solisilvae TaxID=1233460 RepID=UPI00136CAFA6|nr:class I SAM-dependent methyltransferase [Chitinophaga solisilvae]